MGVDAIHLPAQAVLWAGMKGYLPPQLSPEALAELLQQALTSAGGVRRQTVWEVALLLVLSAITYYRRELSSNRVYHPKKEEPATAIATATAATPTAQQQALPLARAPPQQQVVVQGMQALLTSKVLGDLQVRLRAALEQRRRGADGMDVDAELEDDQEEEEDDDEDWEEELLAAAEASGLVGTGAWALMAALGPWLVKAAEAKKKRRRDTGMASAASGASAASSSSPFLPDLPEDVQGHALRFLQPHDVLRLGACSRALRALADSDLVWRAKWEQRFGGLWASPLVQGVLARRLLGEAPDLSSAPSSSLLRPGRVLRVPRGGWKALYSAFELEWPAWLCAGCNTEARCLVGIHGSVYDLTPFLEHHPGSKETILINAGGDATAFYEDVGHSVQARALMRDFLALAPPPADGDAARGIPARCVLARVRDRLTAARQRVEGLVGGGAGASLGVAGVGRRLQSLSGGMSMAEAFTTFPEQAAAVLLGGPLAAGMEEDEDEEDATDAEAGEEEDDDKDGGAFPASPLVYATLGLVESILGTSPSSSSASLSSSGTSRGCGGSSSSSRGGSVSPSRPRCGCSPPCAVSRHGAHFLPAPASAGVPSCCCCPEGLHLGAKRAVLDLVTGEWLSWRSCCGQLRCEQRAAAGVARVEDAGVGGEEDVGMAIAGGAE